MDPRRVRVPPRLPRRWPVYAVAALFLAYAAFAALGWWVQSEAHATGAQAVRAFHGDEVGSLIALVESDARTLGDRNRAVWALGQIGDPRALPTLQRHYTGAPCDHSRFLCQKELKKALDRCDGRNWAPRWLPLLPHAPSDSPREG